MTRKPSQILSYLFLGGKDDAKSKDTLDSLNIKYILNCTPNKTMDPTGCPNYYQKDKAYHYLRVPIFDNIGENITVHLDSTFKFIEEGKHYGNVLVHCHKGVSRSASFVIAYLMRKNEFSFDEALTFVQSVRPMVQPNEAFLKQLASYHPDGKTDSEVDQSSRTVCVSGPSYDVSWPLVSVNTGSILEESKISSDPESITVEQEVANIESNLDDEPVNKRVKLI